MTTPCQHCKADLPDDANVCPACGTPVSAAMRFIGKVIGGKYEITSLLGEGGMGAVYEARHVEVHRKVALKLLHSQFSRSGEMLTRFEREARATGEIGHENIIEVFDLGTDPETGSAYLVMEKLKGHELSEAIRKYGRLGLGETIDIMLQVLSALAASHELGIVHRDLKPDNIFLTEVAGRTNWVKILDFGIAKFQTPEDGHKLTQTGQMMGTPYYMAPEQIQGDPAMDHRLDLYACGVILYEMLTGRVPFDAPNVPAMVLAILTYTPPPLCEVDLNIPAALSDVVMKAMSRDKEARFQSANDLAQALEPYGTGAIAVTQEMQRSEALARTALGKLGTDWNLTPPPGTTGIRNQSSTGMEWTQTGGGTMARSHRGLGVAVGLVVALLLLGGLGAGYVFGIRPMLAGRNAVAGQAGQPTQDPGLVVTEAAVPAPQAPPGAEMVKLRLSAEPAEAAIYLDGAKLPANPYVGSFVKTESAHLIEVKLEGREDFLEWVKFDADVERTVTLSDKKKGSTAKKPGAGETYATPVAPVPGSTDAKPAGPDGAQPEKTFVITKAPEDKPPPVEVKPPAEDKPEKKPGKGIIEESPY